MCDHSKLSIAVLLLGWIKKSWTETHSIVIYKSPDVFDVLIQVNTICDKTLRWHYLGSLHFLLSFFIKDDIVLHDDSKELQIIFIGELYPLCHRVSAFASKF